MASQYFVGRTHAALYAKFRPTSPDVLVKRILLFLQDKFSGPLTRAVDVGCGSGQSTRCLAPHFSEVLGFDMSESQIAEALRTNMLNNVSYKSCPAESLPVAASSVQLVTSCQACHWFDLPKFFKEVDRILVPGGTVALYGYEFPHPIWKDKSEQLYEVLDDVYQKDTRGHWGADRKHVDDGYRDPKFSIPYPSFTRDDTIYDEKIVTVKELQGYISSWSGFQNYKKANGGEAAQKILDNFLSRIMEVLDVPSLPEETVLSVRFKFFLLLGRKPQ